MNIFLESYFSIIRKLIPGKKETNAVGLDIGSGECKLVELVKKDNGFELLSWSIEKVTNGDIAGAVQKVLSSLEVPSKAPYTSVFGKGTLIRYVDMPQMPLEDLQNAFGIEADKYFPFAQDQIYTDCYILDGSSKKKKMSVMAAAVKKEIIDERMKMLTGLGLQVEFIGINPIALANVINVIGLDESVTEKGSAVAVLDMGDSVSSLTILVDSQPRFTRDIYLGGRDLSKRISNALGMSFEEAEALKSSPGKRKAEVVNASETAVMNIVQELRLSFDYFTTERNYEIGTLLLTGGGSMLDGIAAVFEKNLDIKVYNWDLLRAINIGPNVKEEELRQKMSRLGVALGLALYHYD